jgi:hypothetical protein
MTAPWLNTLLSTLLIVSPAFTHPSFRRFLTLFAGWVGTRGTHAVTESLVEAGVSGTQHHAAFHRFFSRACWSVDAVGRLLLLQLVARVAGPLRLAVDDTLCTHKGPKLFGLGVHVDAVRSTRKRRLLTFGHVWVVLTVLVPVPWSQRVWALPVLFRLFRTQADCHKSGEQHQPKTQLAVALVHQVAQWLPGKPLELVADSAYSCRPVLRALPPGVVFTGVLPTKARLQRPRTRKYRSPRTGCLRRGDIRLPNPAQLARSKKCPWNTLLLTLYGQPQHLQYKELVACWSRSVGKPLLKIVIVRLHPGQVPLRVLFCTDSTRSAQAIVQSYAQRWAIEVLFRDLKQLLGFASSRARSPLAVLRTAPWVGVCYTLLVLWALELGLRPSQVALPIRPWYRTKKTVSFEDLLRLAQHTLSTADWTDVPSLLGNLPSALWPPVAAAA